MVGTAQPTAAAPKFEVASIKANDAPGNRLEVTPGTVTVHSGTLATCIMWAYDVQYSQLSGADAATSRALDSDRYDIVGKAGANVPEGQLKLMLQSLLAERFKLTVRQQNKEMPGYALVLAKKEPKLRESEGEGESKQVAKSRFDRQWTRTTMAQFADEISGAMDGPVLDETGLNARYDISLNLTPYMPADLQPGQRPDLPAMMRTAVQEQLGLKLEVRKASRNVLVVDHLEKPSGN